jgi:hypothetical protein
VTVSLSRGAINVFFPVFITIIMWMLIIAETMIFAPYYLQKKKADAPGIPLLLTPLADLLLPLSNLLSLMLLSLLSVRPTGSSPTFDTILIIY